MALSLGKEVRFACGSGCWEVIDCELLFSDRRRLSEVLTFVMESGWLWFITHVMTQQSR